LAFWRWFGGSLFIFGFAWPHLKRDWPVILRHWKIILLLSFLGVAIFNTLVYTGLQYTTAINALLMQSTMPVVIVVMSYVFFREGITPLQAVGVLLSLSGVLTIIAQGAWQTLVEFSLNWGDVIIVVAVFSYSAYSVFLRRRPQLHPLSFIAITFMLGSLMLLPLYLWENLAGRVMSLNFVTFLAVGYVAIFPSILSYLCFNRGVDLVGANRAGLFFHLMPVLGSLLAILLLGEYFRPFHAVGICLIVAGIGLATKKWR
jgi:drug/metabolite transporter (DMT)-like permease